MIDRTMKTPFVARVATNRSGKAKQGDVVEVQFFSKQWDSARCLNESGDVVWLSLKNLDRTGPVSDTRQAARDAERAAFKAKGDAPVLIGTEPVWESDKCVAFDFKVEGLSKRQRMFIPRFFKDGRALWDKEAGTIPQWLWDTKVKEEPFSIGKLTPVT